MTENNRTTLNSYPNVVTLDDYIYRSLFDNNSSMIIILNPATGRIVSANQAACAFYGYSLEIFRTLNISDIDQQPFGQLFDSPGKTFTKERTYCTSQHRLANGEIRDVEIYSGSLQTGDPPLVMEIIHDNTSRIQTEEQLRKLSRAVEQSPISIEITDVHGTIEYVNPYFSTVTGYSLEEAVGKNPRFLKSGVTNSDTVRQMWTTILSGQIWRGEFYNRKKNGENFWERVSISPVVNETGTITHFVAVKEDVTERKKTNERIAEALEFNQTILHTSPIGILIYRSSGECISANPAAAKIVGALQDELLKQNFHRINSWKDSGLYTQALQALSSGKPITSEIRLNSTFGRELWLDSVCVRFESGGESHLLLMLDDITERKNIEENLRLATIKMENWVKELQQRNLFANLLRDMGELLQSSNYSEETLAVISKFGPLLFPSSSGSVYLFIRSPEIAERVANWGNSFVSEAEFSTNDCLSLQRNTMHVGQPLQGEMKCQHIQKNFAGGYLDIPLIVSGENIGLLHIEWPSETEISLDTQESALNVTEHLALALSNIKLRETLRHQSIRDPLTGVFNRRYMEETLGTEIPRAHRKGSKVGIMMLDIDHFKQFNDSFGHEAGDLVLVRLSNLLQAKVRGEDTVCRFGGEEFVLILPDANMEVTQQRAEDIRESVSAMVLEYNGKFLGTVSISIGIAIYPDNGLTGEEVLQNADKALYQAKSTGRNRTVIAL